MTMPHRIARHSRAVTQPRFLQYSGVTCTFVAVLKARAPHPQWGCVARPEPRKEQKHDLRAGCSWTGGEKQRSARNFSLPRHALDQHGRYGVWLGRGPVGRSALYPVPEPFLDGGGPLSPHTRFRIEFCVFSFCFPPLGLHPFAPWRCAIAVPFPKHPWGSHLAPAFAQASTTPSNAVACRSRRILTIRLGRWSASLPPVGVGFMVRRHRTACTANGHWPHASTW